MLVMTEIFNNWLQAPSNE